MSAFTRDVANRSGELDRLCEILVPRGVNRSAAASRTATAAPWRSFADDENAARNALQAAEIDYIERDALTTRLQNVPGGGQPPSAGFSRRASISKSFFRCGSSRTTSTR
jgi:hypothetical protein